ncbi:hypothetical protein B566_EDAN003776 [Ephemera danica]|nr:hypothetical protein B566_EDAN003776 [Ephemera danica]
MSARLKEVMMFIIADLLALVCADVLVENGLLTKVLIQDGSLTKSSLAVSTRVWLFVGMDAEMLGEMTLLSKPFSTLWTSVRPCISTFSPGHCPCLSMPSLYNTYGPPPSGTQQKLILLSGLMVAKNYMNCLGNLRHAAKDAEKLIAMSLEDAAAAAAAAAGVWQGWTCPATVAAVAPGAAAVFARTSMTLDELFNNF